MMIYVTLLKLSVRSKYVIAVKKKFDRSAFATELVHRAESRSDKS